LQTRKLPVIFCSSVADRELVSEMMKYGIAGYVLKPIDGRNLLVKTSEARKNAPPVLAKPRKTLIQLGLTRAEFKTLLDIMTDDASERLHQIGLEIGVGNFQTFGKFCLDLSATAASFGAESLAQALLETKTELPGAEFAKREKYMLFLYSEIGRLRQEAAKIK